MLLSPSGVYFHRCFSWSDILCWLWAVPLILCRGWKKDHAAETMVAPTQYREASSEAIVAELRFPTLSLLLNRFFSVSVSIFSPLLKPYSGLQHCQSSETALTLLLRWSSEPLLGPPKGANCFTSIWFVVLSHRWYNYLYLQFGPPELLLCLVVVADAGLLPACNWDKGAAFEVCLEMNSLVVSAALPLL